MLSLALSSTMCHGHPHTHACGHQSVTWHYCPSAFIDLGTGYETPCQNITFAASQPSSARCPLANCDYQSAAGRGWTCCQCGGRNNGGWCSNVWQRYERNPLNQEWERLERCDHGCCRNCVKDGKLTRFRRALGCRANCFLGGSSFGQSR